MRSLLFEDVISLSGRSGPLLVILFVLPLSDVFADAGATAVAAGCLRWREREGRAEAEDLLGLLELVVVPP